MGIGDRTKSNHRPIEIILEKMINRKIKKEKESTEIEDWSEEGCREYRLKN